MNTTVKTSEGTKEKSSKFSTVLTWATRPREISIWMLKRPTVCALLATVVLKYATGVLTLFIGSDFFENPPLVIAYILDLPFFSLVSMTLFLLAISVTPVKRSSLLGLAWEGTLLLILMHSFMNLFDIAGNVAFGMVCIFACMLILTPGNEDLIVEEIDDLPVSAMSAPVAEIDIPTENVEVPVVSSFNLNMKGAPKVNSFTMNMTQPARVKSFSLKSNEKNPVSSDDGWNRYCAQLKVERAEAIASNPLLTARIPESLDDEAYLNAFRELRYGRHVMLTGLELAGRGYKGHGIGRLN